MRNRSEIRTQVCSNSRPPRVRQVTQAQTDTHTRTHRPTHRSGTQLQWLGGAYGELLVEQERQEEPWLHRGCRCQAGRLGPKPCISIMSPASESGEGATVRAWPVSSPKHPAACPPLCPELQHDVALWWKTTEVVPAWPRVQSPAMEVVGREREGA